jgi:hypothetical protein
MIVYQCSAKRLNVAESLSPSRNSDNEKLASVVKNPPDFEVRTTCAGPARAPPRPPCGGAAPGPLEQRHSGCTGATEASGDSDMPPWGRTHGIRQPGRPANTGSQTRTGRTGHGPDRRLRRPCPADLKQVAVLCQPEGCGPAAADALAAGRRLGLGLSLDFARGLSLAGCHGGGLQCSCCSPPCWQAKHRV